MTEPLASVIIVTWNGRQWLERCLPAVEAQRGVRFETIVVDNGSTDSTVEFIERAFPRVRLIRNRRNRGFAAATNQGMAAARGHYLATLNNDAIAEPDWLAALVDACEADNNLAMAASRMVRLDDPTVFDSAGIAPDRFGFAWNLRAGERVPEREAPCPVFGACAGAALYRRSMLEDVGLFDERFGSYYEDVDLAWRAQLRGWPGRYIPNAVVRHAHSGTGGRFPATKQFLLGRNRLLSVLKNMPQPGLTFALLAAPLLDGAAVARGLLRGETAPLRGRLAVLREVAVVLQQRQRIQRRAILSWRDIEPLLVRR
ncbi:MAG: glycosyltransferase family 2 protein [Chloroflexota bacterium]|nr:glycosyltransferase family 2 protein [Dehalococcoidia bacterium]MDW8253886.1 glycosyltransferase family 2 protein [Chloroflexota bacterium]